MGECKDIWAEKDGDQMLVCVYGKKGSMPLEAVPEMAQALRSGERISLVLEGETEFLGPDTRLKVVEALEDALGRGDSE